MSDQTGFINDTVIAMTTMYSSNDMVRPALALRTARKAVDLGYTVVVVDGGSEEAFLELLSDTGASVIEQKEKGMGAGKRESITAAHDTGKSVTVIVDPEKFSFVHYLEDAILPLHYGKADIAVIGRTSLESYPIVQQITEKMGNRYWRYLTGTPLDMWGGARAAAKTGLEYFLKYQDNGNPWGILYDPVLKAYMDGQKLAYIEVDYAHPPEQTHQEQWSLGFAKKRLRQLHQIVRSLDYHNKQGSHGGLH